MDFRRFKEAVQRQISDMQKEGKLFKVEVDLDEMWNTYLNAFPEGTNPIFRQRREYDCSCCRQFIRTMGNVVAVNPETGQYITIWDRIVEDENFDIVSQGMADYIRKFPIYESFHHYERHVGTNKSYELAEEDKSARVWEHFYVANLREEFLAPKDRIPSIKAEIRTDKELLFRAFTEISVTAIDTVLDLIAQGSLYRGEEFKSLVTDFKKVITDLDDFLSKRLLMAPNMLWLKATTLPQRVCRIKNTVIGELLTNISLGMDLEVAVSKYEAMVAPSNYKRPTALVTPAMVEKAKEKVESLGLTSALSRRFASIEDVPVTEFLFLNRNISNYKSEEDQLWGGVANKTNKNFNKVEEVGIDKFLKEILPNSKSLELFVENRHFSNLFTLTTAVDATSDNLFKWPNPVGWSYKGEVADSIKERVKQAGGNVTGDLCCRLSWANHDDYDLHMAEPTGYHIYFANRFSVDTRGQLDVDMNAGDIVDDPVENIYYEHKNTMTEGVYTLSVNNYNKREANLPQGFEVQIDFLGEIFQFSYPKSLRTGETVTVAEFRYTHSKGIEFLGTLPASNVYNGREVWNIKSGTFVPVRALCKSPNYWSEGNQGNLHYFFMLDNCKCDEPVRGFYNEFLRNDLDEHRKVFEILGSKVRTDIEDEQFSGLGFSSTLKNNILCRVEGAFTRTIKLIF